MSGTSLDGIDVAVVEIRKQKVRTVELRSTPYPAEVREAILAVSSAASISQLNFRLGELYAAALKGIKGLDLIGCHGQTIYHQGAPPRNTMQIGEAAVITERTGVPVVSDFRVRDIAAGGQGAPLVPFADYLLFRHKKRSRAVLNIGGIANFTYLPAGAKPEDVIAFDTGPGNMVIDALVSELTRGKQIFDRDGKIAAGAKVNRKLLDELLSDGYYKRKPPKSTGREQYGEGFIARMKKSGAPLRDLIATATALTAATIAMGIGTVRADEVIVSGGGAHNRQLMGTLAGFLPDAPILRTDEFGIAGDAKEAIAFAILAHRTWKRKHGNLPSATGARKAVVLGKITLP